MRPDRIILGEVRGSETATLFTAMNTGHDGCMGTLHANDARETVTRLTSPPMNVPIIMLPALDLILMQNRFKHPEKGTLRRITEVAEVAGMEGDVISLNKVFEYNAQTDLLEETGTPSQSIQILAQRSGRTGKEINTEIAKRAMCIKWLVDNKVKGLDNVKEVIIAFNKDPDGFVETLA
jgi:flagellar protein FlaI